MRVKLIDDKEPRGLRICGDGVGDMRCKVFFRAAWRCASTRPDGAVNPPDFTIRPTLRVLMVSISPRLRTSSATSRGVQWLTGRPDAAGSSHATATIWTICSAVKVAGVPERG